MGVILVIVLLVSAALFVLCFFQPTVASVDIRRAVHRWSRRSFRGRSWLLKAAKLFRRV